MEVAALVKDAESEELDCWSFCNSASMISDNWLMRLWVEVQDSAACEDIECAVSVARCLK